MNDDPENDVNPSAPPDLLGEVLEESAHGNTFPEQLAAAPVIRDSVNELNAMKAALLDILLKHIAPELLAPYPRLRGETSVVEAVERAKEHINALREALRPSPQPGEYWKNRDGVVEGPLFAIPQDAGGPDGFVLGAMSNGHMSAWRQDGTCNHDNKLRSPYDLIQRVGKPAHVIAQKGPGTVELRMSIPTEGALVDA